MNNKYLGIKETRHVRENNRTWASDEVTIHRTHEALFVLIWRDNGNSFTCPSQTLLSLVLECLRKCVTADSIDQAANDLFLLLVDAE